MGEQLLGQAAGAVAALGGRLCKGANIADEAGLAAIEHVCEMRQ